MNQTSLNSLTPVNIITEQEKTKSEKENKKFLYLLSPLDLLLSLSLSLIETLQRLKRVSAGETA
jgi:hypothetical protein